MFPFKSRNEVRLEEMDRLLPTPELMNEAFQIIAEEGFRESGCSFDLFG